MVLATTLVILGGATTAAVAVWWWRADHDDGWHWPMAAATCIGAAAVAFTMLAGVLLGAYQLTLLAADPRDRPPRSFVEITQVRSSHDDAAVAARHDADVFLLLSATPAVGAITCGLTVLTQARRRRRAPGAVLAAAATLGTLVLTLPLAFLAASFVSIPDRRVTMTIVPFQALPALLGFVGGLGLVAGLVLDETARRSPGPPDGRDSVWSGPQ